MQQRLWHYAVGLLLFSSTMYAQDAQPPKGKFSGLMFGDYYYNAQMADTTKKDLNGFQFRRIYFTYDYAISPKFDSRFRLESDQSTNSNTAGGKLGVMVKDAWLKWKNIIDGQDLIFGLSPTPAFDISEEAWGYRSLEKTIMDLNGIVSSRDLGMDMRGRITDDATVNYWAKVGNNSSNGPEGNKFKRYYGLLQFKFTPQLQATIYGDYDAEAGILDTVSKTMKSNDGMVVAGFLNYHEANKYSFGIEGFYRTMQNSFYAAKNTQRQNLNTYGVTAFAWGAIEDDLRLVGRFDYFDPNSSVDNDGNMLFIAAIDYLADNDVHVMPNIYVQSFQQSNVKANVIGRLTFYFVFH